MLTFEEGSFYLTLRPCTVSSLSVWPTAVGKCVFSERVFLRRDACYSSSPCLGQLSVTDPRLLSSAVPTCCRLRFHAACVEVKMTWKDDTRSAAAVMVCRAVFLGRVIMSQLELKIKWKIWLIIVLLQQYRVYEGSMMSYYYCYSSYCWWKLLKSFSLIEIKLKIKYRSYKGKLHWKLKENWSKITKTEIKNES